MDVPEPWLVEAVKALHDLDNLRLADVHERVTYAEFELEAIVLTGSCVEVTKDGKRGVSHGCMGWQCQAIVSSKCLGFRLYGDMKSLCVVTP